MDKINIVISRSQQSKNICVVGDTEQDHCGTIADRVYNLLSSDNRLNVLNIPRLDSVTDNEKLYKVVAMSNEFIKQNGCKGYHVSIHTDAGAYATGASGLYFSEAGLCFGRSILEEISKITPWDDVGLRQRKDLYELKNTLATAFLLEISFHDNQREAKWIHENTGLIASKIVSGIYKGVNIPQVQNNVPDKPTTPNIDFEIAVDVLHEHKVITDKDYWLNAIDYQINVEQLIINMANKLI